MNLMTKLLILLVVIIGYTMEVEAKQKSLINFQTLNSPDWLQCEDYTAVQRFIDSDIFDCIHRTPYFHQSIHYERTCCHFKDTHCVQIAYMCRVLDGFAAHNHTYISQERTCRMASIPVSDAYCDSLTVNPVPEPECQQWVNCHIGQSVGTPADTPTTTYPDTRAPSTDQNESPDTDITTISDSTPPMDAMTALSTDLNTGPESDVSTQSSDLSTGSEPDLSVTHNVDQNSQTSPVPPTPTKSTVKPKPVNYGHNTGAQSLTLILLVVIFT